MPLQGDRFASINTQGDALGYELLPLQGALLACCLRLACVLLAFSLRAASSLSSGRGDKAAKSGDVDYEYHHIISDVSHNIINAERLHKAACWRYSLVDDKAT